MNRARRDALLLAVAVEGGLIVAALVVGWVLERWLLDEPLGRLTWDPYDALFGALVTLPLLVLFFLSVMWPIGPLGRIGAILDEFLAPFLGPCTILDLAVISVLAGLGEEFFFRGLVQAGLGQWLGPLWGLVAASIVFGLAHLVTPTYAILVGLIGIYLGWLWLASSNLLVPVVTHALYDFCALVYWLRFRTKPVPRLAEEHPSIENGSG